MDAGFFSRLLCGIKSPQSRKELLSKEPTHMDGDGEWTVFDAHFSGGFVVLLRPIDVLRPEL